MNERDDEIAKLIYGTQATYQEMQFAALIRADEREACAKILESISNAPDMASYAAAIRARGNT